MFKKNKKSLLGIDFGHKNIKMVVMTNRNGSPVMERFFIRELPQNAFSDGQIENVEGVAQVLEEGIRYLKCHKMDTAISIHPSMSMSYIVNILSSERSPVEVEQDIESAVSSQLPFPIDELALDWVDLGPSSEQEGMNEFLVVAAKRDLVDSLEQLVEGVNLSCSVIDIDSYIYPRFFHLNNKGITPSADAAPFYRYAVIDIGFGTVSMNIYEGDKLVYTKDQGFSQTFFEELNHYIYGESDNHSENDYVRLIPYLDILNTIHSKEAEEDEYIRMIVNRHRDELSDQIVNLVGFFNMHHPDYQVDEIYITGGGALIPDVCELIQSRLEISCKELDPLENVEIVNNLSPLINRFNKPLLTKAVGIGLRCIFQRDVA